METEIKVVSPIWWNIMVFFGVFFLQNPRHSKLEKADILEMTVRYLRNVQRQQVKSKLDYPFVPYYGMAILFSPHSHQLNQTEAWSIKQTVLRWYLMGISVSELTAVREHDEYDDVRYKSVSVFETTTHNGLRLRLCLSVLNLP